MFHMGPIATEQHGQGSVRLLPITVMIERYAASLRAHLRMGMKDVASFVHNGSAHAVLAFAVPAEPSQP
jgi:hypothetical protein